MPAVYIRTLKRAAQMLGGGEALAAQLRAPPRLVKAWLDGTVQIPPDTFLRCVDYLLEGEVRAIGRSPAGTEIKKAQLTGDDPT